MHLGKEYKSYVVFSMSLISLYWFLDKYRLKLSLYYLLLVVAVYFIMFLSLKETFTFANVARRSQIYTGEITVPSCNKKPVYFVNIFLGKSILDFHGCLNKWHSPSSKWPSVCIRSWTELGKELNTPPVMFCWTLILSPSLTHTHKTHAYKHI